MVYAALRNVDTDAIAGHDIRADQSRLMNAEQTRLLDSTVTVVPGGELCGWSSENDAWRWPE